MSTARMLDVGVFLPTLTRRGGEPVDPVAAARHAEALGFESVWTVDQLVAGTGVPILDSTVVLSAVAGATERVHLGFGVAVLPLHSPVWLAKQVATLQHVSGGRVLLGVGAGGDRHERSWAAAGTSRRSRGRRTDEALRVLAPLIAGEPVVLEDGAEVQLAPGADVPPLVVGGTSDAALRRLVEHGDDWFLFPGPPSEVAAARRRADVAAGAAARTPPAVTASLMTALEDDPTVPGPERIAALVADPDGLYGMPPSLAATAVLQTSVAGAAEHQAALAEAGAHRVIATITAGDWFRQAELLAQASELLVPRAGVGGHGPETAADARRP